MEVEESQQDILVKGLGLCVFPNPTRTPSTIEFAVTLQGEVFCSIYDVTGCLVRTLLASEQPVGSHSLQWDGYDSKGRRAQPGVYFVRVVTQEQEVQTKLVVLK